MATNAFATPITLSKTNAVAAARTDPGTGICGSVTHFQTPQSPLNMLQQAIDQYLNMPATSPNILGRTVSIFDDINFRNSDPSASGDFTAPNYPDVLFPYSADQNAMPPGDNLNIALRLRGYYNVKNTLGGQPMTFAVNCDDACSLTIGGQPIIPVADERVSARVTQQVIFTDPGLYPVEIVYYQNASQAYLEWSRALSAQPEGNQKNPLDITQFQLIAPTDLYSAIIGSNTGCIECGAPGMDCSMGNYCGDGLCQVCNVPNHCGPNCVACPANANICNAGQCVQCVSDAMCPAGETCANGMCQPPMMCNTDSQCPPGQVCDPSTGLCGPPPVPCTTNAECPAGEQCIGNVCTKPPTHCLSDSDCNMYQYCDTSTQTCQPKNRYLYEGGLTGCSLNPAAPHAGGHTGATLALLGLLGLALGGLAARRRRLPQ